MAKLKNKLRKTKKNFDTDAYDKLEKVSKLVKQGIFDEAHDLLMELELDYSRNDEVLESRGHYFAHLGLVNGAWWHMYQAFNINSDNMNALSSLILLCSDLNLPFATLFYIERYEDLSVIMPLSLLRLRDETLELIAEDFADEPTLAGKAVRDQALMDLAQQLLNVGKIEEADKICRRALKKFPNVVGVQHIAAHILVQKGKLPAAIKQTQQIIKSFPNDRTARYMLCKMYYLIGDIESAENLSHGLLDSGIDTPEDLANRIEMLAVLNKTQEIIDLFESSIDPDGEAAIQIDVAHYVATSFALVGNIEQAQKLWRSIEHVAPDIVNENLLDITAVINVKNGFAYFDMPFWIPHAWVDEVSTPASSPAHHKRRVQKLFKQASWLEHLVTVLFEHGNEEGREFALHLCQSNPLPILESFATGTSGTDSHRLNALKIMIDNEMITRDNVPDIWLGGKWQQPELFKYEITYDVNPANTSKQVLQMIERIYALLQEEDWETALNLIEKAREIDPNERTLMNYQKTALEAIELYEEADDILDELFAKHPDYLFAHIDKARQLIDDEELDEAYTYLSRFQSQPKFHLSEMRAYGLVTLEWFIAKDKLEKALNWSYQLEVIVPDLADMLDEKRTNIITMQMMDKLLPLLTDDIED